MRSNQENSLASLEREVQAKQLLQYISPSRKLNKSITIQGYNIGQPPIYFYSYNLLDFICGTPIYETNARKTFYPTATLSFNAFLQIYQISSKQPLARQILLAIAQRVHKVEIHLSVIEKIDHTKPQNIAVVRHIFGIPLLDSLSRQLSHIDLLLNSGLLPAELAAYALFEIIEALSLPRRMLRVFSAEWGLPTKQVKRVTPSTKIWAEKELRFNNYHATLKQMNEYTIRKSIKYTNSLARNYQKIQKKP